MASRNFDFDIVGHDKYSKQLADLNKKAGKAVQPFGNIARSVQTIGNQAHLGAAVRGMGKLSDGAAVLAQKVGLSAEAFTTMGLIGRAGGVLGAIGLVGAAAVGAGVKFAGMTFEIGRTSKAMGVSTDDLQRWRGAANLAGVSSEALDSTLSGLQDAFAGALYDGDGAMQQIMGEFGIQLKFAKNGTLDLKDALGQVADVMSKITDAHQRKRLADVMHIDPAAIPLLMEGSKGLNALADQAAKLGDVAGPKAIKWGTDTELAIERVKVAARGLFKEMGSNIFPNLPGWLNGTADGMKPGGAASAPSTGPRGRGAAPGFFATFYRDLVQPWWEPFNASNIAASPRNAKYRNLGPTVAAAAAAAAGGTGAAPRVAMPTAPGDSPMLDPHHLDPAVQAARDAYGLAMIQQEYATSSDPKERDALFREISRRQAGAATGTLSVDINVTGAAGTTVRTSASGPVKVNRVAYAMDGENP